MRAFLAIELPEPLQRAAAEAVAPAAVGPAWRAVRASSLHLTLRFLGEVAEERRASLDEAWRSAASAAPGIPLRLHGAGAFPHERRARILWIGVDDRTGDGELASLAARVEAAARAHGFTPEERPFTPHITVARSGRSGPARVSVPSVGTLGEFIAMDLVLFRSELAPSGATYHEVERYPFRADSGS